MGRGIAFQVHHTRGMSLEWVADIDATLAYEVACSAPGSGSDPSVERLLSDSPIDVLVEASNSIEDAYSYCRQALQHGAHVVLMNAEVDLAYGPALKALADQHGRVVTSDAGDQHGVLATMISEAELMGFSVIQAGNIKGFLDPYATPQSIAQEAAKRRLSATQCCAYTDGTKLHIEMAVLANALGYLPPPGGMTGPHAEHVEQALELFDFDGYGGVPRVEYMIGAKPGGGVYLIVQPKTGFPEEQQRYLDYYKLPASKCGRYRLLYRPYHLCHLETPKAILTAARGSAILSPGVERTCDVYAHAKRDLIAGESISHAIGSAEIYGRVEALDPTRIPITALEAAHTLAQPVARDSALCHHCWVAQPSS